MKTSNYVGRLAAAIGVAACLCTTTVSAAGPQTLEMQRERQQGKNLCWAAVSTMAVRAFPKDFADPPITQELSVIYGLSRVHTRTQKLFTRRINFGNIEEQCDPITACDQPFEPWLYRVDSGMVADGMVLPEEAIAHEIVVRKRPVIIKWNYEKVRDTLPDELPPGSVLPVAGSLPEIEHSLIITGYDAENHRVRIYDPWPPVGRSEPNPDKREQWQPYEVYVDPKVGLGLRISAVHKSDIYLLRRVGRAAPRDVPAPVRLVSSPPVSLTPVSVAAALQGAQPVIDETMRRRVVLAGNGRPQPGEFIAAAPIPILAITAGELLDARDRPELLLRQRVSSLMVPVTRKGEQEVVDSFLVYNDAGTWKAGGYSNTAIVDRADLMRRSLAQEGREKRDFYLVSIPSQASFFLAHGEGAEAVMALLVEEQAGMTRGRYALIGVLNSLDRALGTRPPFAASPSGGLRAAR
jgi:hypothetical protein